MVGVEKKSTGSVTRARARQPPNIELSFAVTWCCTPLGTSLYFPDSSVVRIPNRKHVGLHPTCANSYMESKNLSSKLIHVYNMYLYNIYIYIYIHFSYIYIYISRLFRSRGFVNASEKKRNICALKEKYVLKYMFLIFFKYVKHIVISTLRFGQSDMGKHLS